MPILLRCTKTMYVLIAVYNKHVKLSLKTMQIIEIKFDFKDRQLLTQRDLHFLPVFQRVA